MENDKSLLVNFVNRELTVEDLYKHIEKLECMLEETEKAVDNLQRKCKSKDDFICTLLKRLSDEKNKNKK